MKRIHLTPPLTRPGAGWLAVAAALSVLAAFTVAVPVAAGSDANRLAPPSQSATPAGLSRPQDLTYTVFIPIVLNPPTAPECPTTSSNSYDSIDVNQWDLDNPVRPTWNHADKNLALRSYDLYGGSMLRELVDYGCDDCSNGHSLSPQLATIFSPNKVPHLTGFYRVHDWNWPNPPSSLLPGTRGSLLTQFQATALGLQSVKGEVLHVPRDGRSIAEGKEAIVLFADSDTVALHYTREDSIGWGDRPGYTVHLDKICTDPNLLALYNARDDPNGPRYVYPNPSYQLPVLGVGQPVGVARGSEVVVAVVDSGKFMDPRSCHEWWDIRPDYAGACPWHD